MAALDGKVTIKRELRQCIVYVPSKFTQDIDYDGPFVKFGPVKIEEPEKFLKALFHTWHPVTGKAIVEYEDGTIHEVAPTCVRFVDNAIREYTFPEMENSAEESYEP